MRSSKQRQRNKQNRQNRPTGGNIVNRVFDSSGPEGKVRGTPQQIIEKYAQLHRDAQLAGDRVNAENFAQHAEHYTRMLAEAQRDIDRAREEQEQFNRDRQAERDRQFEASRDQNRDQNRDRERDRERERQARFRAQEESQGPSAEGTESFAPDAGFLTQPLFPVLVAEPEDDMMPGDGGGLVETPENRAPERQAEPRDGDRPRRERPRREERRPWREERVEDAPALTQATPGEDAPVAVEPVREAAAEAEAPTAEAKARKPRRPRRPREDAAPAEAAPDAAE